MQINTKKPFLYKFIVNRMVSILFFSLLLAFSGCSIKRNVPENTIVVKKNIINIDASEVHSRTIITSSELSDYISLKKNKSFLNFNIWAYNRKQTKFKKWTQKISDNPPSYYNISKAEQSENRITSYLNNRGYFKSQVIHHVTTNKKNPKKAVITYNVKLAKPYSIHAIEYHIPDSAIASIITPAFFETSIKVGQQYDFYKLDDMRNVITDILRNKGYLFLNSDHVFYEIDSLYQNNTLKITLNIRPNYLLQQENKISDDDLYNRVFFLNDIYIKPNSNRSRKNQEESTDADTIIFRRPRYQHIHDTISYEIIETGKPYMRYKALMPSIFLEPGDLFQEKNIKKAQTLISGLPVIGFSDITLDTVSRSLWPDTAHVGLVDARIDLAKGVRQSYSIGVEATNNVGALGASINLSYNNKNIFRGSELFTLQFKLATEIQSNLGDNSMNYSFWLFNTLEGGIQASFTFQKFLAPFSQYRFHKFFRPKTVISAGYNFQKRPDYNRDIVLASFGYYWKPETKQSHKLTLLDINTVKINKTEDFEAKLKAYNNQRLYEQYSDHLIMACNYSYTFSNQEYGISKDFNYVQATVESGGNLLYAINSIAKSPMTTVDNAASYYTLFGIRYAQYLKGSIEFRRYNYLGEYNHLAYRVFFGIGVPYGNALSLPFEKSFYGGGANDLRGWGINIVGPGGYIDNSNYERSGDIKLEANAEFRFGIAGFIKGAVFTDLGNVWLLREENSFPDGNFKFSEFYKQLYWDAGFGLRLDFSFFIIRVDAAVPLYSPGSIYDTKWVVNKMTFKDIVLSFGIGYPF